MMLKKNRDVYQMSFVYCYTTTKKYDVFVFITVFCVPLKKKKEGSNSFQTTIICINIFSNLPVSIQF